MTTYLTYDEYVNYGGTVDSIAFVHIESKAQRYLDTWTQERLKTATVIPEVVKEVLTEMVNAMSDWDNGDRLASFSNGKVSMSFDVNATEEQKLYYMASMMLPQNLISRVVEHT